MIASFNIAVIFRRIILRDFYAVFIIFWIHRVMTVPMRGLGMRVFIILWFHYRVMTVPMRGLGMRVFIVFWFHRVMTVPMRVLDMRVFIILWFHHRVMTVPMCGLHFFVSLIYIFIRRIVLSTPNGRIFRYQTFPRSYRYFGWKFLSFRLSGVRA